MQKTFCDVCKKELTPSDQAYHYYVEKGDYHVTVDVTTNNGRIPDICYDCMMKILLDAKPKRPYNRKQSRISTSDSNNPETESTREKDVQSKHLSISVPHEEQDFYSVVIGLEKDTGDTLKEAVLKVLNKFTYYQNTRNLPEFLSEDERKTLKGILEG